MNYILPLEKEREKYHFEISNDGKELKKSNIIPVVNDNKQDLQNGVVYVESPFQKDEYFDITKFNQQSQDKWREIIRELSSKIGATKIKTTLLLEKEDSINSDENNEFTAKVSGNYKIVDGDASINNTNSSKKGHNEQLSSSLEFEIELEGKKQSIEEVEKWIPVLIETLWNVKCLHDTRSNRGSSINRNIVECKVSVRSCSKSYLLY